MAAFASPRFIVVFRIVVKACGQHQRPPQYCIMPPSLKQRLAALSIAPSSPSSPFGADIPKSPSRRKFNAPWAKRSTNVYVEEEQLEQDRVQNVMSRVIFQAGVDYESILSLPVVPSKH